MSPASKQGDAVAAEGLPAPDRRWALFLDLDGTLIEFAETPDAVRIPPQLPADLRRIGGALGGALALVSGRAVADLDRLLMPLRLPAAGQHGAELRLAIDGAIERSAGAVLPPAIGPRLETITATLPGVLLEAKGISVALHYRQAPQHRAALHAALLALHAEVGDSVELMAGHAVFEVKPRGSTKGTAIDRFMSAAPFAGRIPVFAGDDRTDEDGFAAVIARGGHAIRVGPEAATRAPWRIADPARMRAWLGEIARSLARP